MIWCYLQETSIEQYLQVVMDRLNLFSQYCLGHKANYHKPHIFVSHSFDSELGQKISSLSGISLTSNFGFYSW